MVNRGWIPWDLKGYKYDRKNSVSVVNGVLYSGDNKTKYSKPNQPSLNAYKNVYPDELAAMSQLPNIDAGSLMVRAVDFDSLNRTPMPDVPSKDELCLLGIKAERHGAYETLWNGFTYIGVVTNAAIWLYL